MGDIPEGPTLSANEWSDHVPATGLFFATNACVIPTAIGFDSIAVGMSAIFVLSLSGVAAVTPIDFASGQDIRPVRLRSRIQLKGGGEPAY